VIRFGLRLTFRGGREALVRLAVTAAAVALGVGMLLITLAGINAVNTQNARYAWLNSVPGQPSPAGPAHAAGSGALDPLWWLLRADYFGGQVIGRIDVAATGPHSPVPPGIAHLPGPGQFYASPALSQLIRSGPAAELGSRFPGHQAGLIGPAALPAPNSLIIVVGRTAGQLSHAPGAVQITSTAGTVPSSCNGTVCAVSVGVNANGIDLILSVVAAALLFPVLIFIAAATRLSAARREQRFAAMRLVGAAPRQVSVIAAVESTVAAAAGVAAGFGLFFPIRPEVATVPFTGAPFYTGDLSLRPADILLVAAGIPAAAALAARLTLRRVHITPLGVSRRVTPRPPRAWRLLPLLAGLGELAAFVSIGRPATSAGQIQAYLPGFVLIITGLITAGPWLTMAGSRLMARRATGPAGLIAGRRLADNPAAGFRAISGVALAVFVTSVAIGVITTLNVNRGTPAGGAPARGTLADQFTSPGRSGPGASQRRPAVVVPGAVLARLRSVPGVRGVTVIRTAPPGTAVSPAKVGLPASWGPLPPGLVSCAQLAGTPALGRCPAGATAVAISAQLTVGAPKPMDRVVWDAAAVPAGRVARSGAQSVIVSTDGSQAAIEQARTALEAVFPTAPAPRTLGEMGSQSLSSDLKGWQQLASVVILTSLVIAGCSLAVSVAGGLTDRKRPFSLLRLTGAPLGVLQRVITLETAVPLLAVAVVSAGTGFGAAQLFLRSQFRYSLLLPGAGYYLTVAAGLAVSLAIIASTLPLLSRITGPETARNE
jgi:hypothetical protein